MNRRRELGLKGRSRRPHFPPVYVYNLAPFLVETKRPRFLIAKGGITSNDTAVHGLGIKRAVVEGPLLPGVPVWSCGEETKFPGLKV